MEDQKKIGYFLIRTLLDAENKQNIEQIKSLLSHNFIGLTRSNGMEQNKDELLQSIARPKNISIYRVLEDVNVFPLSENIILTKSFITVKDNSNLDLIHGGFRNIHIFTKEDEYWRCIVWQVTKILSSDMVNRMVIENMRSEVPKITSSSGIILTDDNMKMIEKEISNIIDNNKKEIEQYVKKGNEEIIDNIQIKNSTYELIRNTIETVIQKGQNILSSKDVEVTFHSLNGQCKGIFPFWG